MNKKTYITPVIHTVVIVPLSQMLTFSGGDKQNSVKVDGNVDDSDEPNRSRHFRNVWDDDEESSW